MISAIFIIVISVQGSVFCIRPIIETYTIESSLKGIAFLFTAVKPFLTYLPSQRYYLQNWHCIIIATSIIGGSYLPVQPLQWVLGVSIVVTVFTLYHRCNTIVLCIALGVGVASYQGIAWNSVQLLPAEENSKKKLQGRVVSLVEITDKRLRFQFEDASGRRWLAYKYFRSGVTTDWVPRAGDCMRFTAKLRKARGFKNPNLFDYESYLAGHSILGSALIQGAVQKLEPCSSWHINMWRQQIADYLRQLPISFESIALIKALVIGDARDLSSEQWTLLQKSGIIHLIVISGLHIGIIATLFFALGAFFERAIQLRWYIRPHLIACFLSALAAIVYAALSGFGTSAVRATIMVLLFLYSRISSANLKVSTVYLCAFILVLLLQPRSFLLQGFWLSFGAVAILLFFFSAREKSIQRPKIIRYLWGLIQIQVALTVGMMGLLAINVGYFNILGPMINLILVPLYCLLIVPLILANTLLAQLSWDFLWIWQFVSALLQGSFDGLIWLQQAQFLVYFTDQPLWLFTVLTLAIVILLQPFFLQLRLLSLLPLVAFILPNFWLQQDHVRVSFLDVGQGLASTLIVRENGRTYSLIFDTGAQFSDRFSSGSDILVPYLQRLGIRRVDTLVISHSDSDHAGGAASLLEIMPVDTVFTGQPIAGINSRSCSADLQWQMGSVHLQFVHPSSDWQAKNSNDSSCTLLVKTTNQNILFTGDITATVERQLPYPKLGKITVLAAPHHGSKTSSSRKFIQQLQPQHIVFSSGYLNRFQHPHRDIIARYKTIVPTAEHYLTSQLGAVEFLWGNEKLQIMTQR